jgi:hypothetical protein
MLLTFFAAAASLVEQPTIDVNGWRIEDLRGRCTASTSYSPDVLMALRYEPARDRVVLGLMSPRWRSISAEGNYPLTIRFSHGRYYSTSSADGFVLGASASPTFGVDTVWNSGEFLADFAVAEGVEFKVGDTRLGRFSLKGSRQAAQALIRCGERSFRNYPGDPFATYSPPEPDGGTAFQRSLMR